MGFYKIILVVICGVCMSLTGCSASFCGFGQGEELVFSCEEPLIESATAQETEPEKEEETSAAVSKEQMADTPVALPDTRIDLNLATVEELVTLKGIGGLFLCGHYVGDYGGKPAVAPLLLRQLPLQRL